MKKAAALMAINAGTGNYDGSFTIHAPEEGRVVWNKGTYIREQPKIGRNEACPCGSGLKYKKCHGGNNA